MSREGIWTGVGQGLSEIGASLRQRYANQAVAREKQASDYETQAKAIAANIQNVGGINHPDAAPLVAQLQDVVQKHNALYPPHETPALVARIQKVFGSQPGVPKPDIRAQMTPASMVATAPVQQNPIEMKANWLRTGLKAANPTMTDGEINQQVSTALANEFKTNFNANEEWLPMDKPYMKNGQATQLWRENKTGKTEERPFKGPVAVETAPSKKNFNPATGGLYSITDPKSGKDYGEYNLKDAPPEIQQEFKGLKDAETTEQKRKDDLLEAQNDRADKRREAAEAASFKRLQESFQNSLDRKDYADAKKLVTDADAEYQAAIDRARTMEQNLAAALKGDQQAMLSLVANHIGMTLGAQKGARINQAVWNEAVASTPWLQKIGAKFSDQGYLSGVTLAPDQMQQMVGLAHEKLDTLKDHKERLLNEYDHVLKLNQQSPAPGDLKVKAKPATPVATSKPSSPADLKNMSTDDLLKLLTPASTPAKP